MTDLILKPIGVIHSPFREASKTPIQNALSSGAEGEVEIFPEFAAGLRNLEGFERIWLVFWFNRAKLAKLIVTPYLDNQEHGVFATRAPSRPNPIGLSCVRLLRIEGRWLHVADLDILDETPLLDIKPYAPVFDCFPDSRIGWLQNKAERNVRADNRFESKD